jgi:hypothetical protein
LGFCEKDSKVGIETASGKSVEGTYYGCLRRTIAPINHSRTSQKPQHKYLQENHQKRQEMRVFEGRNLGDESWASSNDETKFQVSKTTQEIPRKSDPT